MTTGYDDPGRARRGSADRERVIQLVSAYGVNPDKWPEGTRHLATKDVPVFAEQFAAEAALDAVLSEAPGAEMSDALRLRLLSDYQALMQQQRKPARFSSRIAILVDGLHEYVWPGAPWWKPAFALSLSLLIGVSAGLVAPNPLLDPDDQTAGIQDAPATLDLGPGQQ